MSLTAIVAIWVAYLAGWSALRSSLTRVPRPRWWAVLLWCVVAVPSLGQLVWAPGLLAWGQRESSALAAGEWWRLLTAIGLQDGGWGGTVFNLTMLAVTLLLVGELWRPWVTVLVFVLGGVGANLLTASLLGTTGAGNSMATLCLVAAAAVTTAGRRWSAAQAVPLLLLGLAAAALILTTDQHGLALALGVAVGVTLSGFRCARVDR